MGYDMNAPLWTLTIGEFADLIGRHTPKKEETPSDVNQVEKYSYGLQGLADLLGCSKTTAWKIKDSGKLKGAVVQEGRKIIIDNEKALELLGRKKK